MTATPHSSHEANSGRHGIAHALLQIGAVTLRPNDPFTWTSGIRSPIYCDNRLTLSHPLLRGHIADAFATLVAAHCPGAECIAGTATAGIPHAALIADRLALPLVYVRANAKAHGKQNLIEGRLLPGQRVVLVEDTVSTGGSVLAAAEGLRAAGVEVPLVLAIFTYGFTESIEAFANARMQLQTLTDFPALIDVAVREGYIAVEDRAELLNFSANPQKFH